MGGQARWVLRANGSIAAEIDDVVAWWSDPDRKREQLDELRRLYEDLSVVDSSSDSSRVREMIWTSPISGKGYSRMETPLGPVERSGDRYLTRSATVTRLSKRHREITTRCEAVTEFAVTAPGVTSITTTHTHIKTGGHWEERWLPPVRERQQFRRRLQSTIVQYRTTGFSELIEQAGGYTRSAFTPGGSKSRWWKGPRSTIGVVVAIVLIVATLLWLTQRGPTSLPSAVSSITTASVNGTAQSIVMTPDGHYAYVLSGDKYVYVLDLESTKLVARILLGETGQGFAMSPDGRRVYVVANAEKPCGNGCTTSDSGSLFALSTTSNHIVGRTDFANSMDSGIAVSPDGRTVYVEGDGRVEEVNTMTYRADSAIRLTRDNSDLATMAISPGGKFLYGATDYGSGAGYTNESFFYVIDLTNHAITATLSSKQFLTDIAPNPLAPVVYVTHLGGAKAVLTVEALNLKGKREHSLNIGEGSSGIAVTANGAIAYLATQESGVIVLNTATLSQIATIPSSSFGFYAPGPVAVSSSGRRLCVLEGQELGLFGSNKVWIVNLRPFRR